MYMWRLRRQINSDPSGRSIEVGHAPASLEGRRVTTLEDCMYLGFHLCVREGLVRSHFVAHLPVKDMIALLFAILAQDRRARIERLMRIDQYRQFFVLDLHQLRSIRGGVLILQDRKSTRLNS